MNAYHSHLQLQFSYKDIRVFSFIHHFKKSTSKNTNTVAYGTLWGSVPFKALWRTIGSSPWKIGSTDFVTICKKDAFSW